MMHPGASCPSKRWPKENFRHLARNILNASPGKVLIIGDKQEAERARFIAAADPERIIHLAGELSLKELAALFSMSRALVSNDSGPVHLAAAVGLGVVSIFGRNQAGLSATRWRPLGDRHVVVQKNVGCVTCLAHACPIDFECLKAISVEDVWTALQSVWSPGAVAHK